jgi:hypothetical protein
MRRFEFEDGTASNGSILFGEYVARALTV